MAEKSLEEFEKRKQRRKDYHKLIYEEGNRIFTPRSWSGAKHMSYKKKLQWLIIKNSLTRRHHNTTLLTSLLTLL